ncbi:MAG TPA: glutamyl-tRNA reductase [Gemmatimonadales bacterium]|nr:glutamyl-tRNA reductase [Gemmatimonadales bacterium]
MVALDVLHDLSFHVVGVSHHTATVGVREQFAVTADELAGVLACEHAAGRSALLLFTCNRCELYWSGAYDYESWFGDLARARGVTLPGEVARLDGIEAVRHLFTVTAGLDSQILGETEILGQVRRAYDAARAAGTTTREMDAIFSAALAAGRRVRRETLLGRHPTSVSSAAVELAAKEWIDGLGGRPIVVLGAGEAAEGVLSALHLQGATNVALVNRNPQRAAALAEAWGAVAHGWERLPELAVGADLLFVATAAARPVVSAAELAGVMSSRPDRRLVTMDLSVPRNVQPEARAVPGLQLFDLDDLQRLCCPAAGTPAAALRDAERLLDEEITRLEQQLRGWAAAPRLAELHRHGAQIAEQEAAWALGQLGELSEQERLVVREMADRLVRRVLYPVSRSLREEQERADAGSGMS